MTFLLDLLAIFIGVPLLVLAFAAGVVLCMALSGCAVRTCNPGEPASMWCHQSW